MSFEAFKIKVKQAFSYIKADMAQIKANIEDISIRLKNLEKTASKPLETPQEMISIGNEGVHSRTHSLFTHTLTQPDTQLNTHFLEGFDVEKLFQTLTNKEFLVFLTIFQSDRTTYERIAHKLSLTSGCVRSYVSSLLKKGAPVIKRKLKNQKVVLTVNNDFKTLTSEQKLTDLYYSALDPDQTRLI